MKKLFLYIALTAFIAGCNSSTSGSVKSQDAAITSFSINGAPAKITGHYITVNLPAGAAIKHAVANIVHNGVGVLVNGNKYQQNKEYDFTNVVNYDVIKSDGSTQRYQVRATVAQDRAYAVGKNKNNFDGQFLGRGFLAGYDTRGSIAKPGLLNPLIVPFQNTTSTVLYPMQLTTDESGKYIYAIDSSYFNNGGIYIYKISEFSNTGLTFISKVLGGNDTPSSNLIFGSNGTANILVNENSLVTYKVDDTGLTQLSRNSLPPQVIGNNGFSSISIDPYEKNLYGAPFTHDNSSITQYRLDENGIVSQINSLNGNNILQNDIALTKSLYGRSNIYVTYGGSTSGVQGQIDMYYITQGNFLQNLGSISTFQYDPGLIITDPTDKYVYVATDSRTGDSNTNHAILMYHITGEGTLAPINPPSTGNQISAISLDSTPVGMVMDKSGKYLFVQTSQSLLAYRIGKDGLLELVDKIKVHTIIDKITVDKNNANQFALSRYLTMAKYSSEENVMLYTAIVTGNVYGSTNQHIKQYNFNFKAEQLTAGKHEFGINTQVVPNGIFLDPSHRYTYLADNVNQEIDMYRITSDGSLSPLLPSKVSTSLQNIKKIIFDASENFAYALGDHGIDSYKLLATGVLTKIEGGHISIDNVKELRDIASYSLGNNSYVYISNDSSVLIYKIDESSGKLVYKNKVKITKSTDVGGNSSIIEFNRNYLYLTNAIDNNVVIYNVKINGDLEKLPKEFNEVATGIFPKNIIFDLTGDYAYVINIGGGGFYGGSISMYKVSRKDGSLIPNGQLDNLVRPSFLKFDASGNYLYMTSFGLNHVYTFTLNHSTGKLTEIKPHIETNVVMSENNSLVTY